MKEMGDKSDPQVRHSDTAPTQSSRADSESRPLSFEGRSVALRPVCAEDMLFLYQLAVAPETGFRWRYRGGVPSPEQFSHELWQGVLVQLIVVSRSTKERLGVVFAITPDLRNGTVTLGVVMIPVATGAGRGAEAAGLFLDYLFRAYPLRKIYGYAPGWNVAQFRSGLDRLVREEGRLHEHEYYDGRYWDMHIFAIYRSDWESLRDRNFEGRRLSNGERESGIPGRRHLIADR